MVNTVTLVEMIEVLPEEDKELLFNMAKRLVLAWDPDFTKLTPGERKSMRDGEDEEGAVDLDEYIQRQGGIDH